MATTVSNTSQLQAALASAASGEVILVEGGNYGAFQIRGQSFSDFVTLRSADPSAPAVFESVAILDSDFVRIDGVLVANPGNGTFGSKLVTVDNGSRNIEFINSEVHGKVDDEYQGWYGLHAGQATNVLFENNFIHDVKNGIVAIGVDNVAVIGNTLDYIGNDSMKFGDNNGVLIKGNIGARHMFPAEGAHVDFIQFQQESSNIQIDGNVSLPETPLDYQGIFMGDSAYDNVEISNNIIYNTIAHGISLFSGANASITNNTVLTVPGSGHKASIITAPPGATVENNISSHNSYNSGQSGSNLVLQWDQPDQANYYDSAYVNASRGFGITIEDLAPVAGSAGEALGAHELIAELLGAAPNPSDLPNPESPAPDPENSPSGPSVPPADPVDPPAVPTDGPEPKTGAAWAALGTRQFSGSRDDVLQVAHSDVFELDEATLAFTFNADSVSGRQGLLSKDATGYAAGGHFTALIESGEFVLRFQSRNGDEEVRVPGIEADTTYEVVTSFGPDGVKVWLDGAEYASSRFATSWLDNVELLQVGANGWASKSGGAGFGDVFAGTMSDVLVLSGRKSPTEVAAVLSDTPDDTNQTPTPPPPATPTPPASGGVEAMWTALGPNRFSGSRDDIIEVAHSDALALEDVTISLAFNAETVSGRQGLISKDATGYADGGHFSALIVNGDLVLRFQSEDGGKTIRIRDIEAGTTYELVTTFGPDGVTVWLDGVEQASSEFALSWDANIEWMQLGANGWGSAVGEPGFTNEFTGTISDVIVVKGRATPTEIAALLPRPNPGPVDPPSDTPGDASGPDIPSIPPSSPGITPADPSTDSPGLDPILDMMWSLPGDTQLFGGRSDVVEIAHADALALPAATIGLSFAADRVTGLQGLLSKDARGYGDGDHFNVYLDDDALVIRFQGTDSDEVVTIADIEAGATHNLVVTLGPDGYTVWLDGEERASSGAAVSLERNSEALQVGGNGWASASGAFGYKNVFSGTISDVVVLEGTGTPADVEAFFCQTGAVATSDASCNGASNAEANSSGSPADLAFF